MNITMPRGDIRSVQFTVTDSSKEPVEITFDEIYFTVKRTFADKRYLFQKKLSSGEIEYDGNGEYHFTIEAADTDNLNYGIYAFDIELVRGEDIKQTTVGRLELTVEATHAANEVSI